MKDMHHVDLFEVNMLLNRLFALTCCIWGQSRTQVIGFRCFFLIQGFNFNDNDVMVIFYIVPVSAETRHSWCFAPFSELVFAAANSAPILYTIGACMLEFVSQ